MNSDLKPIFIEEASTCNWNEPNTKRKIKQENGQVDVSFKSE